MHKSNKIFFSKWIKEKKYKEIYTSLVNILDKHNIKYNFLDDTKDIWVRDFMPVQISKDKFVSFKYNPDYLKNLDEYKTNFQDMAFSQNIIDNTEIIDDIVIDGGNVVKSDSIAILTNKIYKKIQIMKKMS